MSEHSLVNLDQLDVEDQIAAHWPAPGVSKSFRNPESTFFALHHQLHAFGPPTNDPVQPKGDGFMSGIRAVEQSPIRSPPRIVHRNRAGCIGMPSPRARFQNFVAETTPGPLRVARWPLDVSRR